MPEITTIAELVDQVGSVITFPDPLGELRERGFTLAPDVQARLDAAGPPARLDPARRQQLAALAGRLGPVRIRVTGGAQPSLQPLTASLGYDVTAGLRFSVLNGTLAALSEGLRYPREVNVGIPRPLLDALSADVPPDVTIGPLRLTAPATVSAIDGTDHLLFAQQFSLDFRRTFRFGPGAPRQVAVSSLDATARLGVEVSARIVNDTILLGINARFPSIGVDQLVLTVAPESPVQPRSPAALSIFAAAIEGFLRDNLMAQLGDAIYSLSPVIGLPLPEETDITITNIGVRTFSSPDGDVIVAAVDFDTPDQPAPGTGDPATLGNPFPAGELSELNTYVRFTETALRKVVKAAQRSGALEDILRREFDDNLRVDGADVQLAPNLVRLILDVRMVDACPVLLGSIDMGARVTVTISFSVFEGRASVTVSADIDLDNTDAAVCVILNPFEVFFAATGIFVGQALTAGIFLWKLAEDSAGRSYFDIFSAIFYPLEPVTGTEVLPEAEAIQALVSEDRLEALGTLSLRPDNINTYVYAQFLRSVPQPLPIPGAGQVGQPPTPINDAVVQLMDQDVPRPAEDDAQPPAYSRTTTTSESTGPGYTTDTTTTTTVRFLGPTADQQLARERTDDQGRVQFVLTPADLRNSAGEVETIVETQITRRSATSAAVGEPTTRVTRRGLPENLPDVYFRVTPPDGPAFDTRLFDNGLMINLRSRRIGTAAAPLVFLTGRQGPVVLGRSMITRLLARVVRPRRTAAEGR